MKQLDIINAGKAASDKQASIIAEGIVKNLVDLRIKELVKMQEISTTQTSRQIQKKLDSLRNSSQSEWYRTLVKEAELDLTNKIRTIVVNTAVGLINAEYFDFSGRIR